AEDLAPVGAADLHDAVPRRLVVSRPALGRRPLGAGRGADRPGEPGGVLLRGRLRRLGTLLRPPPARVALVAAREPHRGGVAGAVAVDGAGGGLREAGPGGELALRPGKQVREAAGRPA